jgi:membrane protein YdbS with pleckstrin-like domain
MAFPKRLLIAGEDLILDLRPHPVALALPALTTLVAFVAAVWLSTTSIPSWIPWVAFVIVLLVYPISRLVWWLTSIFAITTDRVIHREGWIAKRSMEIPLEAINDVRFEQGVFDRVIGAGSLIIQSASEHGRQEFEHIRHPEDVQKTIYEQGETNKKRMYRGDQGGPGGAPSVSTELERLANLRATGILTEEEFQAQKAKVLGEGG